MFLYFLKRFAVTLPTYFGLMFLVFLVMRVLPGDPIELRVGERGISSERLAFLRQEMGLDQPLWQQFLDYCLKIFRGDFGTSFATNEKVLTEFFTLFPATLELTFFALVLALLFSLPLGTLAALGKGSWYDKGIMFVSVAGFSVPIFWWGLLLIMFFSEYLGITPVSGRFDLVNYHIEPVTGFLTIDSLFSDQKGAFRDVLWHLALPSLVLSTVPLAVLTRITRAVMLEILSTDYVRTAWAKGLSPLRVVGIHSFRNALIPIITVLGVQISTLVGGAVLTENIFSWPGIGKWFIESIHRRDYPSLQGGVMLISAMIILINVGTDLLYALINPKIRHQC